MISGCCGHVPGWAMAELAVKTQDGDTVRRLPVIALLLDG
jgi:hypothetical protein